MNFVKIPNLPQKKVAVAIVSAQLHPDIIQNLFSMGISTIKLPPCENLPPPVASHPDLLVHYLGNGQIIVSKNVIDSVRTQLTMLGFNIIKDDTVLFPEYPHDIPLDAARIGDFLFCCEKCTDKRLLQYCAKEHIQVLSVKQGYSKCSVCIVNEDSIITADEGIAFAAGQKGISVLKIREGSIKLPGYNYGFIGGCCGKVSKNKIGFLGDITLHPDYSSIKRFLGERGIEIMRLGKGMLCDFGGIIPVLEN